MSTEVNPLITLAFFGVLLLLVVLFLFRSQLLTGAKTAGGMMGTGGFQNHAWLIVAIIVIPVGYFMLTIGKTQSLLVVVAIVTAIFALNMLMKSPPKKWTTAAIVAAVLLFISWEPTWRYVEDAKNWWAGTSTQTPGTEEVEAYRYVANATGGAYELRDDSWLVFHWPDGGHCVRTKGVDVGYIQRIRDSDDLYWILSREGTDTINVKVLAPGETWNNYTCPRQ